MGTQHNPSFCWLSGGCQELLLACLIADAAIKLCLVENEEVPDFNLEYPACVFQFSQNPVVGIGRL